MLQGANCSVKQTIPTLQHTTGNRDFAECKILCRVSKIRHSAKTFFAECGTRQRIALDKEFFAECRALVKKKALGKGPIYRVPGSWQNCGTRHRLPCITVFNHVLLCRVSTVRHSAKIFFLVSLPSAPDLALGKDLFFLNSLPSVSDLALGKEIFFIFKILCRVPPGRHLAKI